MKSYFAKLADRATLPNVSAASTASAPKLSDPFESQVPDETQLPSLIKTKRAHNEPEQRAVSKRSRPAETTNARVSPVKPPEHRAHEELTETVTLEPRTTPETREPER